MTITESSPTAAVCGPIYGVPDFRQKFEAAQHKLQQEHPDWTVTTPLQVAPRQSAYAEGHGDASPGSFIWATALRLCLARVVQADMVWLLPGWERSTGARIEAFVAWLVDIPVYLFSSGEILIGVPPEWRRWRESEFLFTETKFGRGERVRPDGGTENA